MLYTILILLSMYTLCKCIKTLITTTAVPRSIIDTNLYSPWKKNCPQYLKTCLTRNGTNIYQQEIIAMIIVPQMQNVNTIPRANSPSSWIRQVSDNHTYYQAITCQPKHLVHNCGSDVVQRSCECLKVWPKEMQ